MLFKCRNPKNKKRTYRYKSNLIKFRRLRKIKFSDIKIGKRIFLSASNGKDSYFREFYIINIFKTKFKHKSKKYIENNVIIQDNFKNFFDVLESYILNYYYVKKYKKYEYKL